MRAAVLTFSFRELGADIARSGAYDDNPRSLGVSRALGYRENGRCRRFVRDEVRTTVELEIRKEEWSVVADRFPTRVNGFDACRHLFEAAP